MNFVSCHDVDGMSYVTGDLSSQRIVSTISGAGIILFCESEYACFRLFRRRTTLFFFITQLAIWASALTTALSTSIYFLPYLRVLPMLVLISIARFVENMSYPIMMLLRLRFVQNFPIYIMYIPVILATIFTALRYYWIRSVLAGGRYCFNIYHIIQPIVIIILTVEYIVINIFFIVIAIKHFQNIVHVRSAVIINLIVIVLECAVVVIAFVVTEQCFMPNIILCVITIVDQIKVRLEIEILSYIVQSVREPERRTRQSVTERNKFFHPLDFFLSRTGAAGLTN
jgi:hypothetical protein